MSDKKDDSLIVSGEVMYPILSNKTGVNVASVSEAFAKLLSNKESIYEEILKLIPCNVFWKNTKGEFLGCNQIVADIFDFKDPRQIIGKTNYDLFAKEMADKATESDLVVFQEKRSIMIEEIGLNANKEIVVYMTTKTPLLNEQKEVIGLLGVAQNITAHKKIEQMKQVAIYAKIEYEHKILEEKLIAQQINNKYVGIMAHELRTPIATFKLYADLIKSVIQNPEMSFEDKQNNIVELVEKCYEVEKSSTQFIDMILYRLRSTNNKLDPERFNLCLIADDIEDVLDTYAFGSGERALITVKKANAFTYKGDSVATKHIVSNLIKNTLKIIKEEDKGKITISFDQSDEKYNKMIFEDNAKGIDEKFLPLIFDSFVYKDSSGKGTGLGLAFCKMIMVDYGGDIICESELGKYTRFTCLFPKVDMSEFDIP